MGAIVKSATFGVHFVTAGILDVTGDRKRLCLALLCPCRYGHAHNCILWLLVWTGVLGRPLCHALLGLDGDLLTLHLSVGLIWLVLEMIGCFRGDSRRVVNASLDL